jgi:hypothetical protein
MRSNGSRAAERDGEAGVREPDESLETGKEYKQGNVTERARRNQERPVRRRQP